MAVIAEGGDAPSLVAKVREMEARMKAIDPNAGAKRILWLCCGGTDFAEVWLAQTKPTRDQVGEVWRPRRGCRLDAQRDPWSVVGSVRRAA